MVGTMLKNCGQEFALPNTVTVLFVYVGIFMQLNRRHYFRSKLPITYLTVIVFNFLKLLGRNLDRVWL